MSRFSRRDFLSLCGLGACAGCLGAGSGGKRPPNLVIVFPDQMRAQALGFMGCDAAHTPRLDAFAKEACTFTQAVSNYPVCSPFRAILMSGAMPWVSGVTTNCVSTEKATGPELRANLDCWSDVLARAGYDLCYIGKWHLDAPHRPWIPCHNNRGPQKWNEWCPPARRHGFNRWYSYGTYDRHLRPMYWDTDAPREGFRYVDQWGPEHEADKAIEYLRAAKGPFAMVVSMNPPHTGYELVPKRYLKRYKDRAPETLAKGVYPPAGTPMGDHFRHAMPYYLAAVEGVDEQFGRILDALEESGHAEDTVVLFCSDHGCYLGAHGLLAKNNPYEESMRIPCLIRWPGKIAPRRDEGLVDAFDLAPTLLGLLGQPIPGHMVGRNLAPYLRGEAKADLTEPRIYLHLGHISPVDVIPTAPLPDGRNPMDAPNGRRGLRGTRYKSVFAYDAKKRALGAALFDLREDPHERRDLAAERPDLVAEQRALLKARLAALGDPFVAVL